MLFLDAYSKIVAKEEEKMRKFNKEEAMAIITLVKQAETGNAMDIEDFFEEIEQEERSRKQYRKNIRLELSH